MLVFQTLPTPTSNVWYLAYGSNLAESKFTHDRGIIPVSKAVVTVPGWTLVMDSAGVPYSEPSFGSISPIHNPGNKKSVQLIGTAYLLTPAMYKKAIASEGGGIAYAEVEVRAEGLTDEDKGRTGTQGTTTAARSLVTLLRRTARPSDRYMNLIRGGANEAHMPLSYLRFLQSILTYAPRTGLLPRIGAALFLAFWVPIMSAMERITKASLKNSRDANAPIYIILMVRLVVLSMWFYHDYVHAPVWGRGDGLDGS